MALLDNEKGEAIYFLGYPAKTLVAGTIDYSARVAERFTSLPDHFEARIRKTMSRLRDIDTKLDEATARFSVTQVEGVVMNQNERGLLIQERKRLVLQLSHLLDLPQARKCSGNIGVKI